MELNQIYKQYHHLFAIIGITFEMENVLPDTMPLSQYYLKFQMYPTFNLLEKFQFQFSCEYQDDYYSHSDINYFHCKRTILSNELNDRNECILIQKNYSLPHLCQNNIQYHSKQIPSIMSIPGDLLTSYQFRRSQSSHNTNVYFDEIINNNLIPYSIITIKMEVSKLDEFIYLLSECINDDSLSTFTTDIYEYAKINPSTFFYPAYSKFCYSLLMSINWKYYYIDDNIGIKYDVVEERMNIITSSISNLCYNKNYIWSLSYQINFFHALYNNSLPNHLTLTKSNQLLELYHLLINHKKNVYADNTFIEDEDMMR